MLKLESNISNRRRNFERERLTLINITKCFLSSITFSAPTTRPPRLNRRLSHSSDHRSHFLLQIQLLRHYALADDPASPPTSLMNITVLRQHHNSHYSLQECWTKSFSYTTLHTQSSAWPRDPPCELIRRLACWFFPSSPGSSTYI